jgi:hypothetical protein
VFMMIMMKMTGRTTYSMEMRQKSIVGSAPARLGRREFEGIGSEGEDNEARLRRPSERDDGGASAKHPKHDNAYINTNCDKSRKSIVMLSQLIASFLRSAAWRTRVCHMSVRHSTPRLKLEALPHSPPLPCQAVTVSTPERELWTDNRNRNRRIPMINFSIEAHTTRSSQSLRKPSVPGGAI